MSTEALTRTPIFQAHVDAGAKMVPFAGYEMPVQYTGVIDEHRTVRSSVGLFDVSHMGEVELLGPSALDAANSIISNDLERIEDGQALYTVMCKEDGGIIDDLVVYRFSRERIFICVNASNRAKDFEWIRSRAGGRCTVRDRSDEIAQIAVQGPKAEALVSRLTSTELGGIGFYRFTEGEVGGAQALISRTGYTGEDGFELYVDANQGLALWRTLIEAGDDLGVRPIGLGARDSLRLEMKFCLYGNDIDEDTNPLEAGLAWVVKLDKASFVGKSALEAIKSEGVKRKLVGFEMTGKGIPRQGYPILVDGQPAGQVTSGTKGPSVDKAIGIGYVPKSHAKIGSSFDVEIRGRPVAAQVVKTPFYQRA